jgi:hypothetical protein
MVRSDVFQREALPRLLFRVPFETTRWSLVVAAGSGDPSSARAALATCAKPTGIRCTSTSVVAARARGMPAISHKGSSPHYSSGEISSICVRSAAAFAPFCWRSHRERPDADADADRRSLRHCATFQRLGGSSRSRRRHSSRLAIVRAPPGAAGRACINAARHGSGNARTALRTVHRDARCARQ